MAKKGKKGGKRGKSRKGKEAPIPTSKANEFMTAIKIEACKLSMANYRHQYMKIKEEMRVSKEIFTKLEDKQFRDIKDVLNDIDGAETKTKEMGKLDLRMQKEMALQLENESKQQQLRVKDLQDVIDRLERELDTKADDLNGLAEFRTKTDQQLNEILQGWKDKKAAAERDHQVAMNKLLARHATCVQNNNIRAERIINAAEGVASGKELERMPDTALEEERLHRRLKDQISLLKSDLKKLKEVVFQLEQKNMELIKCNLSIDYDLKYLQEPVEQDITDSNLSQALPGLPPLKEDFAKRYRTVKVNVANHTETAKEIVVLEMAKRKKENVGLIGDKVPLHPSTEMGPTRFYSPLVKLTPLKPK